MHYIEVFYESDEQVVKEDEVVDGEYEIAEEEKQLHQTNKKIAVLSGVVYPTFVIIFGS